MPEERRQFSILYRDFLRRIVDLDVLSSQGDIEKLLGQFAAMLAAFNLSYLFFAGPKYLEGKVPAAQMLAAIRGEFEFLVSSTMAVAGLFTVLAWNNVLPDRRDSLILGLLPVRTRTVLFAKVAAIATALGVAVVAVNMFTGLVFPFLALPAGAGWLAAVQAFAGYWLAMAATGMAVCCSVLALQGLAVQALPYRLFLRVSSFLQLTAFFVILAAWFLRPPGAVSWMPSSWFFGLQQQLSGAIPDHPLAGRALWALLAVAAAAAVTFALAYGRSVRKIVEQPDIAPSGRRRAPRLSYAILRRPIDRAIVLFTARTVARSRQHRLFLAAYAGIGLAVAFSYARDLLYRPSNPYAYRQSQHWNQLNVPLLTAGLVLLCFAVAGTRAIFSLPVELRANWVFRLTVVHAPRSYLSAVRTALVAVTVLPVWLVSAATYFLIWPPRHAAQHLLLLALAAFLLVHRSLHQFRKIPFACSYLPGKSNVHVKVGVYGLLFLSVLSFAVQIEYATIRSATGFTIFCSVWLAAGLWAWWRWREFANSPYNWLQFEDLPVADLETLDLHNPPPSTGSGPLPPLAVGVSVGPPSIVA